MLFYAVMEEWLHFHQLEVSGSSTTLYERNIDLIKETLGSMEVNEITQKNIQDFFIEFHKNGLKENTILNYSKPISMSLRYAVEKGYIDTNPYYGIKIPKGEMQIASLNGHLCHIWRPACDLNGGQPRTH